MEQEAVIELALLLAVLAFLFAGAVYAYIAGPIPYIFT
jgi:hypothetical protein